MKLQIVGSGGIWNKEASASYLIDDHILVDIPNGCCKALAKIDAKISLIDHVLITHFHGDHYFDIPFYFLKKYQDEETNINIYCTKNGRKKIEALYKLGFADVAKELAKKLAITYNSASTFMIGDYQVKRIKVSHGTMKEAYGYIFTSENLSVGFTGDTAFCENVDYMASVCDYLICDCSLILGNESHMGIDDIKKLAAKYPEHKFVTSHMFSETIKEAKKLKIKNIIVPSEGDIIIKESK